jgi:endo-1,4-beta-mannosidase
MHAAYGVATNEQRSIMPVTTRNSLDHHRFGLNYTPSKDWWFCWNDWNPSSIQRDLDAISGIGADHLRIMLIWPFFQPNPGWMSTAHIDRLNQLLTMMGERRLDALVTVFTGWLSGYSFLPPFLDKSTAMYTDSGIWAAQELFIRELARNLKLHDNIIGFDFGNEMNCCWSADTPIGDAWMEKMFALMDSVYPGCVHVNGTDHQPWFRDTTFSPSALASKPFPVMHAYPYWAQALKYGGPMDPPSIHLLAAFAALIRSYAGNPGKRVWAGEFNTCIEALSDKEQAEWLETAVASGVESGVSWFTYWDSHDVSTKFRFDSMEYKLGVLTNDGKVKRQGEVFRRLAEFYGGKPVKVPVSSPPPPPRIRTFESTWAWILDYLQWKPARA